MVPFQLNVGVLSQNPGSGKTFVVEPRCFSGMPGEARVPCHGAQGPWPRMCRSMKPKRKGLLSELRQRLDTSPCLQAGVHDISSNTCLWWAVRDSNSHGFHQRILSPSCLPISATALSLLRGKMPYLWMIHQRNIYCQDARRWDLNISFFLTVVLYWFRASTLFETL